MGIADDATTPANGISGGRNDERRMRTRWTWIGFAVAGALWVITLIASQDPVARALATLFIAAIIRAVYVYTPLGRSKPFLAPALIFTALLLTLSLNANDQSQAKDTGTRAAITEGVAADTSTVTPTQRCVGINMRDWDQHPKKHPSGLTRARFTVFAKRICNAAKAEGVLLESGQLHASDLKRIGTKIANQMNAGQ